MLELLTTTANLPFTTALILMVMIALLEGASGVVGAHLGATLDHLHPGITADGDLAPAGGSHGPLSGLLGWMRVGEVPALIVLLVMLTSFGLTGLSMQRTLQEWLGFMLPASIAWLPPLLATFPITRVLTGALRHILPGDETEAVSRDSFAGRQATVVTGTAMHGAAAEARVTDAHGQRHYIMVEAATPGQRFEQGASVLVVARRGSRYVIDAIHEELQPERGEN